MQALAADTAGQAIPIHQTPEFWVLVAFVILLVAVARPVARILTTALDKRAETIRKQIDDAASLRDEAQELLASFQRKFRNAEKEAGDIVDHAREEAARLAAEGAAELERSLARREQVALERIAQAEAKALAEVREATVDAAIEAARRVLGEMMDGKRGDAAIDAAIKDVPKRLH